MQTHEAEGSPRSESPGSSPPSGPKGKNAGQGPEEDEEDIWPEDVERYFQEALKIYPPIGRRKLLENGKMYGRNELIAKYIFQKTGKIRTRKQVSSHIQVLGKKQRKQDGTGKSPARTQTNSGSSGSKAAAAPQESKSNRVEGNFLPPIQANLTNPGFSGSPSGFPFQSTVPMPLPPQQGSALGFPPFQGHMGLPNLMTQEDFQFKPFQPPPSIPSLPIPSLQYPPPLTDHQSIRNLPVSLKHFLAYLENTSIPLSGMVNRHHYISLSSSDFDDCSEDIHLHQIESKYFGLKELFEKSTLPCFFLAKCFVNTNSQGYGLHALYVKYESKHRMTLKCSTTVYSFGKAVVEKIQVEDPILERNSYAYYFNHSPMCDYMVQFIDKLRGLNDVPKMNRVLENFSVLQVIIDTQTNTTLMCTAFLFEAADGGDLLRNKVSRITHSGFAK